MKALYRSKVEQILTYMGGAITGFVVGGLTSNVCFVAGTVVSTECGKKVIENIKKGELVWAQDENTGEKMLKKVLRTFINETNELVYVEVNGEIITSTPGHPYFVAEKGWVCAGALEIGDKVFLKNGCIEKIQSVKSKKTENPVKMYNFEVDDFHTYFVGNIGIFAHNSCNVVDENGVKIQSNYPNDHGKPVHLHVIGEGKTTKLGPQGKLL